MDNTRNKTRPIATRLGLRFQNTAGRLKFEKGGPTHTMWVEVMHKTLPRGGGHKAHFEDITDIVTQYGPEVWTPENDELLSPGERDGYVRPLHWPADREEIIGLFRELYDGRQYVGAVIDESDLVEPEHEESNEPRKRWRPAIAVRPEPGVTRQIDDLFLTELWVMTQDGLAATVNMGKHQTIADLFAAVEKAFAEQNHAPLLGSLQKIVMVFNNLGPSLQTPQVLYHNDHDQRLQWLRLAIWSGYAKYREDIDGEVVIALCTAFFEGGSID